MTLVSKKLALPLGGLLFFALLAGGVGVSAVTGSETPRPIAALDQAAAALRAGERALAESRYRDVLLEGWLLIGDLEMADGRVAPARGSDAGARRRLAQALLEAGQPEPAVQEQFALYQRLKDERREVKK